MGGPGGGGGARGRRPRGEDRGGGAGRSTRRHVWRLRAHGPVLLSHEHVHHRAREAGTNLERVRACRRANSPDGVHDRTSKRPDARAMGRARTDEPRNFPAIRIARGRERRADVEWSRADGNSKRQMMDSRARCTLATTTSTLKSALRASDVSVVAPSGAIRGDSIVELSGFGRAFRFRSAFLSCECYSGPDSVRVVRGQPSQCRTTPRPKKRSRKVPVSHHARERYRPTSAVPSRRRRIRSRVAFARPIGDVRRIVDRAETRRERPRAREVTRDARVR